MADWTNKVAIICGGSSGLGLSVARVLVEQNCGLLVLIGRNNAKLSLARDQLTELSTIRHSSTRIETISADLTEKNRILEMRGAVKLDRAEGGSACSSHRSQ